MRRPSAWSACSYTRRAHLGHGTGRRLPPFPAATRGRTAFALAACRRADPGRQLNERVQVQDHHCGPVTEVGREPA